MDLLCDRFTLAGTRASFTKLQTLRFVIGLKFTREDGKTFWSTDSRRDILSLQGRDCNGNAFCCEAICFVHIDNVLSLQIDGCESDRLVLVLVRWFSPHADSRERDCQRRPLCPGPLSINNCLWSYSRTTRIRRAFVTRAGQPSRSFNVYKHLFGNNRSKQYFISINIESY